MMTCEQVSVPCATAVRGETGIPLRVAGVVRCFPPVPVSTAYSCLTVHNGNLNWSISASQAISRNVSVA